LHNFIIKFTTFFKVEKIIMISKKVVIITGASSGIGLACSKEFSNKGFGVVMASRNLEQLRTIEQELKKGNPDILAIKVDVSIENDCKVLIDETIKHFGRIDVLINNAGISMRALFNDLDLKVLHSLMNTNFWGSVYCTKYSLPHILKQKGSVVGVSSIAGFMGLPGRTGYSASKFALQGFLETIRIEYRQQKLHVMVVAPGFTASNIRNSALIADGSKQGKSPRDENKMMTSEKVAYHIYKGVVKRKRQIVLTTQGKLAVLLRKFFPELIDYFEFVEMSKEANSPWQK
jgi:dehydrogenase/reductase SDR family member 7B